jgi:hypothetical protein
MRFIGLALLLLSLPAALNAAEPVPKLNTAGCKKRTDISALIALT